MIIPYNLDIFKRTDDVKMKNTNGEELVMVQIAGLIARRIVCDVKENEEIIQ